MSAINLTRKEAAAIWPSATITVLSFWKVSDMSKLNMLMKCRCSAFNKEI